MAALAKSRRGCRSEAAGMAGKHTHFQGWKRGHSGRELPLRMKGGAGRRICRSRSGEERPWRADMRAKFTT